jgi:hypothetical protein
VRLRRSSAQLGWYRLISRAGLSECGFGRHQADSHIPIIPFPMSWRIYSRRCSGRFLSCISVIESANWRRLGGREPVSLNKHKKDDRKG